jgi:hypothetical protein
VVGSPNRISASARQRGIQQYVEEEVMNRVRSVLVSAPIVIAAISSNAGQARDRTNSDAAFKQLTTLAGEWQAIQDGTLVRETYTVTANGSALLVETKPANKSAMITMVTVDGDRLIATHYCSAGNQPHMVNSAPGDLRRGLTFSLERVTGLTSPHDWHNTGLTITLDDSDHMTQQWTYLYKGQPGRTEFHYTRKH